MKTGLVLSGGAARGAYQMGVIKALAEQRIEVDMVSGASIGALNGVLVASSSNMLEAADKVEAVWDELSKKNPMQYNEKSLALNAGLLLSGMASFTPNPLIKNAGQKAHTLLKAIAAEHDAPLLDDTPIREKFDQHTNVSEYKSWKPIWVSVFEGSLKESIEEFIKGDLLRMSGKEATYLHLQSLPADDVINSVMASAALPLLYQSQQIQDGQYFDGGIRDNTPVKPLLGQCDLCISIQLSNGSLFDRKNHEHPRTRILEIRPSDPVVIEEGYFGGVQAMVNFSADKIQYLARMGYEDTLRALESVEHMSKNRAAVHSALDEMDEALDLL
ncbi:patatin-like phospholipase family protein [Endozoicomonas sp. 4G]|uniref:patatin-like phospholipase family protein n=1 Tax=Endozoicomonas sp. 4G TaxID=2872754 RepID=UPI0023EF449C|nr:patatin-like phospholipase family protein [Endozoicomonas sp. 4G]